MQGAPSHFAPVQTLETPCTAILDKQLFRIIDRFILVVATLSCPGEIHLQEEQIEMPSRW